MISEELRKWKISNIFLVPLLKISRKVLRSNGFIDSYLYNKASEVEYPNVLHMLYKPTDMVSFNEFVEDNRDKIVDEMDYEDHVLITYSLPDKLENDYALIKNGSYSKVSEEFRSQISTSRRTLQSLIFNKDPSLKKWWEEELDEKFDDEQEVWSVLNEEDETFKIENI